MSSGSDVHLGFAAPAASHGWGAQRAAAPCPALRCAREVAAESLERCERMSSRLCSTVLVVILPICASLPLS